MNRTIFTLVSVSMGIKLLAHLTQETFALIPSMCIQIPSYQQDVIISFNGALKLCTTVFRVSSISNSMPNPTRIKHHTMQNVKSFPLRSIIA